eukprot:11014125-Alexandrium_andersonii.AAC.1
MQAKLGGLANNSSQSKVTMCARPRMDTHIGHMLIPLDQHCKLLERDHTRRWLTTLGGHP